MEKSKNKVGNNKMPGRNTKGFFEDLTKAWSPPRKKPKKKSRLKGLLTWLAKGAKHICPT
jgi:hypothetical protein